MSKHGHNLAQRCWEYKRLGEQLVILPRLPMAMSSRAIVLHEGGQREGRAGEPDSETGQETLLSLHRLSYAEKELWGQGCKVEGSISRQAAALPTEPGQLRTPSAQASSTDNNL